MGIRFLANRAEIFSGNSGNYYLSVASVKSMFWHLFPISIFGALSGVKLSVAATLVPKGLGTQNPTKKLVHVRVLLGHLLSQNRVPKLADPGPLLKHYEKMQPLYGLKLYF